MSLPKVSDAAAALVAASSFEGENEEARIDRMLEKYKQLSLDNPTISKVMFHMINTRDYQVNDCLATHAFGYGTEVYELLKAEFENLRYRMPLVSASVVGPLTVKCTRDFNSYLWDKFTALLRGENPEIAKAAIRWFTHFENNKDRDSTNKVLLVGVTVYKLIESQWDANILEEEIGERI